MAPATGDTRTPGTTDVGARAAGGRSSVATELLLLEADVLATRLPDVVGLRERRFAAADAFRAAVRALRRGVIVVMLPPGTPDDVELVARTRMRRDGVRALLVNAPEDADVRLHALALGFDDAVPASVGPDEIRGRIGVLADRTRVDARDRLPVGAGTELDLTARALRRDGRLVHLRPMEFRLLEELARHPGRPVTREWLLRRVWGSHELDGSRTVDVHMRWLRAKVERDPERPEHLLTVRGVGYQLELGQDGPDAD